MNGTDASPVQAMNDRIRRLKDPVAAHLLHELTEELWLLTDPDGGQVDAGAFTDGTGWDTSGLQGMELAALLRALTDAVDSVKNARQTAEALVMIPIYP